MGELSHRQKQMLEWLQWLAGWDPYQQITVGDLREIMPRPGPTALALQRRGLVCLWHETSRLAVRHEWELDGARIALTATARQGGHDGRG
jgi:hypothetical protein